MKRLSFLLIIVLCSTELLHAQSVIDKFFQKYQNDPAFTVVNITPKMFTMFSKVATDDPDFKKITSVTSKLKGLRILVKEDAKDGQRLYREAAQFLTSELEELMSVRSKDADVKFMVKENNKGNIGELVMLVGSTDTFLALTLFGDLSLNEISDIAKDVKIDGFENLSKLPKKKP